MAKRPVQTAAKKGAAQVQDKSTAVAKARSTSVATMNDDIFANDAGMGMESVTTRDLIIPRIGILQKLSPELDRSHAKFIKGAKEGDFCNIGMNEIIPSPMLFVPCYFKKQWLEWAPRKSGEGLKGIHDNDHIMAKTKQDNDGKWVLPNKNYVVETSQLYVDIINEDGTEQMLAFIPFVSTQHKKVRQLLTDSKRIQLKRPDGSKYDAPLYYRYWKAETIPEDNNEGNWMGWKLSPVGKLNDLDNALEVYDVSKQFSRQVHEGVAKAEHGDGSDAPSGGYGRGSNADDDGEM